MPTTRIYPSFSCRILLILAVLTPMVSVSGQAFVLRTYQSPSETRRAEERWFYNITQRRVPVSVVGMRKLQNDHWLRHVEIEVRNDSSRPIYFLNMILDFPDVPEEMVDGRMLQTHIHLNYGRWLLGNRGQYPGAEDAPINPGDTYVFRVPKAKWKLFESQLARRNLPESAVKRVSLCIDSLRFEDGSGFMAGGYYLSDK